MAQTIRPRTKVVYDTQQERRNSTPAGVAAYDAARGAQITPQRLAPQRPPFSEMPIGQANYQPRVSAPPLAQQPQTQQFGGQPAPRAGTPQAANWMQAPQQQPRQYQPLMAGVNSALQQLQQTPSDRTGYGSPVAPQGVMNYGPNVVPQYGNSYQPPSPNSSVFLPRAGMASSSHLRAQQGYQTDQYGRQYQMTPEIAGTAMPTGGAGGWMQGQSLGGAPHGLYVQSNLPSPGQAGMDRVAAGQQGLRPSAFSGPKSSAAIAGMAGFGETAGTGPGAQRYNDMKTRRQQMSDQRIIARARMRGLGQNTPAVRAAMQRQGMLTQGQGIQGGPAGFGSAPGQVMAGSGVQVPPNARAAGVRAAQLATNPFLVNSLQGVDPGSAPASRFLPLLQSTSNPADAKILSDFIVNRQAADPNFLMELPLEQRLLVNAYTSGGHNRFSQMQQSNQQQTRTIQQQPGVFTGGAAELGYGFPSVLPSQGPMSEEDQKRILRERGQLAPYRGAPQF